MLTVRIKGRPTIGALQGPYEASIANRGTWVEYAQHLDRIVKFLGPDKSPDDVFRQDVAHLHAYLMEHYGYSQTRANRAISMGSSFWAWMMDFGLAGTNPFLRQRVRPMATRPVDIVLT
jgi:site-specific recombinase XerD